MAFDVILKPAAVDNVPNLKAISTPNKEISQEIIEKKLKEADERRMVRVLYSSDNLMKYIIYFSKLR